MSGEAGGGQDDGAAPATDGAADDSDAVRRDGGDADAAETRDRAEEYLQSLQRLKADFDNYRRRTAQDQARWGEAAVAAFVTQLLPVVDNLERAAGASGDAAAVRQGVEMTLRQMRETLGAAGVAAFEAVGRPFDPERHEAVARGPAFGMADGLVAEEYRRGYLLRGTVLRAALVKVATAGPVAEEPGHGKPDDDGGREEGEH